MNPCFLGGLVVGTVLLVTLQGNVPHVVYWLWKVNTLQHNIFMLSKHIGFPFKVWLSQLNKNAIFAFPDVLDHLEAKKIMENLEYNFIIMMMLLQVPATEHDRPVADDDQHDRGRHLLRSDPRPRHLHHTESGLLQETVQ